jgi:hypothetical protein
MDTATSRHQTRLMNVFAITITPHTGIRLAELGFLLGAVAGGLFFLGALMPTGRVVNLLAGAALAGGSVLLIIATRWGHFG